MTNEERKILLDRLQSLFPDERDKRLVNDLAFLRSAAEDFRSFGKVAEELLTIKTRDREDIWKFRLVQDIVDSLTWVNRLSGVYVQALTGLHLHLKRVGLAEVEARREEKKEAKKTAVTDDQPSLLDQVERMVP